MDDEIKKEAERIVNLFFKHSKGQTDDVRKLHAKMNALICIDEKCLEVRLIEWLEDNEAEKNISVLRKIKHYITEHY